MKETLAVLFILLISTSVHSQVIPTKFGQGLRVIGKDSSYYAKIGFRFQNLYTGTWTLQDDDWGSFEDYRANMLVRRTRLKFDGWALNPNIVYKLELALSNRDNSGGASSEFRNASNIVLDASVAWRFYKNFTIQFGQRKLPGNRERVISSGNMQFVDRSLLNSRYNIDRDVGLQLKHHHFIGDNFLIREVVALSQGEGRNVTAGYFGGFDVTYRVEFLPFGRFQGKGDYVGAAIIYEPVPKLSIGVTYDNNNDAVRERGQLGRFIRSDAGSYYGKDLNTVFIDMMFKYRNWSVMSEYAHKTTEDNDPRIFDVEGSQVGTFFTGTAFNVQAGYMFSSDWELAARYTTVRPDEFVSNDITQYTFGISKYVVGHKLKVQTDFSYSDIESGDDLFSWRTQVDFHF